VRLLNAYDIKCTGVTKGPGGGVTELACEFNAESLAFKVAPGGGAISHLCTALHISLGVLCRE
jgi:hypothetical protein